MEEINGILKERVREKYNKEIELQLNIIKKADCDSWMFLRKILWDLRYVKRRAERS